MAWPDLVIAAIFAIGALKGWKRGLVSEIGGFIAIVLAFWAAFHYNGAFDGVASTLTQAGAGSAHIIGMIGFALVIYLVCLAISFALGMVVKLPVLGIANNVLGLPIGIAKAAVLVWAILYVALFFPLQSDVRSDLRRSTLVQLETQPNAQVDSAIVSTMPWFMRPFVGGFLKSHRV
ncbi:MAG: CvpA family protein [Candidatus Eremiobacteraeota bacterium]|nr:CvpA family protein [Candidatus Eremiobacteraeota bacterium]